MNLNLEGSPLCQHDDSTIEAFLVALANGSVGGKNRRPRSLATIESYRGTINAAWVALDKPWPEVTEADLWSFINRPKPNGQPRAQNSICQGRAAVVQFFNFAARKGVIGDDPTTYLGSPGQAEATREPVRDEDWLTVWRATKAPDDRLALGLGYYCGLRRSEIVSLPPEAIQPGVRKIKFFQRKGGKTKKGLEYGALVMTLQRGLPHLGEGADEWLDLIEGYARFRHDMDHLLPIGELTDPGKRLADRLEHHILPAAGLDKATFTPHSLRHSFATNMVRCGMPVELLADAMSHSSIDTTRGYVDMTDQIDSWYHRVNEPVDRDQLAARRQFGT